MTALDLFRNDEFELAITPHDADGFHVQASGVARALGFREAHDLIRTIPDSEKGSELSRTLGGEQQVLYLTEAGFYRALGQRQAARIKSAAVRAMVERFQGWVYGTVLPEMRRAAAGTRGSEVAALDRRALALMVIEAEDARAAAEARAAELAPRAAVADALIEAKGDYSVREAAQILARDHSIDIGQGRLFKRLYDLNWLDRKGQPYQRHVEAGRLTTRVQTYDHPRTGEPTLAKPQVRITGKGLAELHRALSADGKLVLAGV